MNQYTHKLMARTWQREPEEGHTIGIVTKSSLVLPVGSSYLAQKAKPQDGQRRLLRPRKLSLCPLVEGPTGTICPRCSGRRTHKELGDGHEHRQTKACPNARIGDQYITATDSDRTLTDTKISVINPPLSQHPVNNVR